MASNYKKIWKRSNKLQISLVLILGAFPGGTALKNLPTNAGDVRFLIWEDPLKKEMTIRATRESSWDSLSSEQLKYLHFHKKSLSTTPDFM